MVLSDAFVRAREPTQAKDCQKQTHQNAHRAKMPTAKLDEAVRNEPKTRECFFGVYYSICSPLAGH